MCEILFDLDDKGVWWYSLFSGGKFVSKHLLPVAPDNTTEQVKIRIHAAQVHDAYTLWTQADSWPRNGTGWPIDAEEREAEALLETVPTKRLV